MVVPRFWTGAGTRGGAERPRAASINGEVQTTPNSCSCSYQTSGIRLVWTSFLRLSDAG
jgi:hypothetical protein